MLRMLVGYLGYAAQTCGTSQELAAAVAAAPPRLILADYHLGTEPAGSVLARLHDQTPAIPLLMMTGDAEAIWRLRHAGIPALLKPFTQQELARALQQLIGPP